MTITSSYTQELQLQTFTHGVKPMQSKAKRLEKVAQEYEALFAKMLIQSMYKSINTSQSLFSSTSNSTSQKVFDDMLYEQYSNAISKQKLLGISTLITEHYKNIT